MADPIRVILNGAAGRMGKAILSLLADDDDMTLAGALEHPDHPSLGTDVGEAVGLERVGVPVTTEVDDGDEHFWGCGECGNVWYEREELDEAIGEITSRFAYRKKVYRQQKGIWHPVPLDDEPEDYEERVEEEWDDEED